MLSIMGIFVPRRSAGRALVAHIQLINVATLKLSVIPAEGEAPARRTPKRCHGAAIGSHTRADGG